MVSMPIRVNNTRMKKHGAGLTDYGDFILVACTSCAAQYVLDDEHLQMYLDPDDLSKRVLWAQGEPAVACRGCGAELVVDELPEESIEAVRQGPWSWSLD